MRPLAAVILSISLSLLLTSQPAPAQSSVPKGLDPTVQMFPATPSDVSSKPANLTKIDSAKEAKDVIEPFQLKVMKECVGGRAILLHTAEWKVTPPKTDKGEYGFALTASQWTGFEVKPKGANCTLKQSFRVDKNPLCYGETSVVFVGIDYFDGNGIDPKQLQLGYKVSTTASTPQNVQDLGTLVAALVGFKTPTVSTEMALIGPKAAPPVTLSHFFVVEQPVSATSPPPYSINVTPVLQPAKSTLPAAVANQYYELDLSGKAGRGNTIEDMDVSGAPGMKFDPDTKVLSGTPTKPGNQKVTALVKDENNNVNTFSLTLPVQDAKPANGGGTTNPPTNKQGQGNQPSITSPTQPVDCTNVSASSPCTFTRNFPVDDKEYWDVSLGLAIPGPKENVFKASSSGGGPASSVTTHTDAYAFADFYLFAHRWPKVSYAPHLNAGIPITSQSLHRPYAGLAEDISPWLQRHGFPLDLCIFGGVVFMKQQLYDPIVRNQLRIDWAHKAMYGVEVPISSIASKLSSKSKSSSAKSGGSQ